MWTELFLSFFLYAVYFYPVFLCYHASYRSRVANLLGKCIAFNWCERLGSILTFKNTGFYSTLVLFGLRVVIDLPSFVITYAREVFFLSLMILASVPAIIANCNVLLYFFVRIFAYSSCDQCRLEFLQVEDIEEQYVRNLFKKRGFSTIVSNSSKRTLFLFISNCNFSSVQFASLHWLACGRLFLRTSGIFHFGHLSTGCDAILSV